MREERASLNELAQKNFDIGYVGEQNHTRVVIACASLFNQYPSAVATMVVRPPRGDIYPVVLTRNNNAIIWNITSSDVAYAGNGQYQLTFTDDEEIIKQVIGSYFVKQSLVGSGEPPTPIADWIAEANDLLVTFEQDIESKIDEPDEPGTDGQVLTSDGNGGVEWRTPSGGGGGGGTSNYNDLSNKPKINSVTLTGNKSLSDLGIAAASDIPTVHNVPSGGTTGQVLAKNSNTNYDLKWVSNGASSYTDLTSKPQINNVSLVGNKSLSDLGIAAESDIPDISGKINEPPSDGTDGQVLATDGSGGRYWKTVQGGGGTFNYNDLSNKPQIAGTTLSGNKSLSDLGIASASDVSAKYTKPQTGIPSTDLADSYIEEPSSDGTSGQVLTTDGNGGRTWTTVQGGGGGTSDYTDLTNKPQINSVTLTGNKTLSDLGIAPANALSEIVAVSDSTPSSAYTEIWFPETAPSSIQVPTYAEHTALASQVSSKITAPSSPATGSFLVYNGSSWVAQTFNAWQGGSY